MTRNWIVLPVLALAACEATPEATTPVAPAALEQAPPPGAGGLTLSIDGMFDNGASVTFDVTGASPGQPIRVYRGTSESPGALCPGPLAGLCLDVTNPKKLLQFTADGSGNATQTITVPGVVPPGAIIYFQAVAPGAGIAATSAVVAKFNPLDDLPDDTDTDSLPENPRIMGLDIFELAAVTPGVSYAGFRDEIYWSTNNGLDVCTAELPVSSTGLGTLPPCPSCTFAFQIDIGPGAVDASDAGDCDYIGLDDATLAGIGAFQGSSGFDAAYYWAGYGAYPTFMYYSGTSGSWVNITTAIYYGGGVFAWTASTGSYFYY